MCFGWWSITGFVISQVCDYNWSFNESLPYSHSAESLSICPKLTYIYTHIMAQGLYRRTLLSRGGAGKIGFRLIPNTLNYIIDHKTERLRKSHGGYTSIQSVKQEYQWVPREHGVLFWKIHSTRPHAHTVWLYNWLKLAQRATGVPTLLHNAWSVPGLHWNTPYDNLPSVLPWRCTERKV